LVEVQIEHEGPFDVGTLAQPRADGRSDLEQVPYLEHLLDEEGASGIELEGPLVVEGRARIAFFVHYLEENWQLRSPVGMLELPTPTPPPERLKFIAYFEP
jgi:hypothetical protein